MQANLGFHLCIYILGLSSSKCACKFVVKHIRYSISDETVDAQNDRSLRIGHILKRPFGSYDRPKTTETMLMYSIENNMFAQIIIYHSLGKLNKRQIERKFLIFARKQALIVYAIYTRRQSLFSGKENKNKNTSKCRMLKFLPGMLSTNYLQMRNIGYGLQPTQFFRNYALIPVPKFAGVALLHNSVNLLRTLAGIIACTCRTYCIHVQELLRKLAGIIAYTSRNYEYNSWEFSAVSVIIAYPFRYY